MDLDGGDRVDDGVHLDAVAEDHVHVRLVFREHDTGAVQQLHLLVGV